MSYLSLYCPVLCWPVLPHPSYPDTQDPWPLHRPASPDQLRKPSRIMYRHRSLAEVIQSLVDRRGQGRHHHPTHRRIRIAPLERSLSRCLCFWMLTSLLHRRLPLPRASHNYPRIGNLSWPRGTTRATLPLPLSPISALQKPLRETQTPHRDFHGDPANSLLPPVVTLIPPKPSIPPLSLENSVRECCGPTTSAARHNSSPH